MKKAIKIRIYPNDDQIETLSKQFGCVRWVYNHMLNLRIEAHDKLANVCGGFQHKISRQLADENQTNCGEHIRPIAANAIG